MASPPSSAQRRGHTRSISHPFNGALSGMSIGMGRRRNRSISKRDFLDSDDDDDFEFTFTPAPLPSSPKKPAPRAPPAAAAEELTTGRCLTCNTMVRWPKTLATFRCTECLMVNDREASLGDKLAGDDGRPVIPRKGIFFLLMD